MSGWQTINADEVAERLPWPELIESIRNELVEDQVASPDRGVFDMRMEKGGAGNLLIMPAWIEGQVIGVKLVTFSPQSTPSINASYVMFDGNDGKVKAVIDGDALTERRTAAASALASSYLSRSDSTKLLIVGTGQLSANMAMAHASVRPLSEVLIWGRNPDKADQVALELSKKGLPAKPCRNLEEGCARADIVSSVTSSKTPVVLGNWIGPGTHLDFVGSFKSDMRESDDDLVAKSDVYVDTRAGALKSGDLCQPIETGAFSQDMIKADLRELAQGHAPGRQDQASITLFKSAGFALEDLDLGPGK